MSKQDGQEATLDIQYIMGITPGLKTEFWLFSSMDFCGGDLANWTATLMSDENPPFGVVWLARRSTDPNKTCNIFGFGAMTAQGPKNASVSGYAPTPMPVEGNCTVWASITGKKADASADSSSGAAVRIVLWPSWPASSGWVTSVGATRFIGQKAGAEEMATDQFGSGFSWMFNYSTDAAYQTARGGSILLGDCQSPPAFPTLARCLPWERATKFSSTAASAAWVVPRHPPRLSQDSSR